MSISRNHSNRSPINWLAYDINDKFIEKFSPLYKGVIYDLGCGEAPYRDFFLQHCTQYIGVDWTGTFHNTKADIAADLNKTLPIEPAVADTIISLSVLEHLCEPQTMLDEAYRILKPGGNIIIQVPWQWWIHEAPYDYFRYSPYGLQYLLAKAGLKEIVVEAGSGYFTTAILKWNYFSSRFCFGNKLSNKLIRLLVTPTWYVGQKLAPKLDRLDKNWSAESSSYWVTAKK